MAAKLRATSGNKLTVFSYANKIKMGNMYLKNSIIINQPKEALYDYLKYSLHQNEFSVWNMADPNQKTTTKGTDGTIGFVYTWDSMNKNVGAGSQEIVDMKEGESIGYAMRFERPMKSEAASEFRLKALSDTSTEVSWDFSGPTKFPMSLFTFIFKRMLAKDMIKSLENLKAKLES